jgi:hypothetical protein
MRSVRDKIKAAGIISLLAGIWLFLSPWVYGAQSAPNAYNTWTAATAIIIFSVLRIGSPVKTRMLGAVTLLVGVWVFAAPWLYGYSASTGRLANSLCVGVIVFVTGTAGWSIGNMKLTGI